MKIVISEGVKNLGITHAVSFVASNLKVKKFSEDLKLKIDKTVKGVRQGENSIDRKKVSAAFKQIFDDMGYPNVIPAGEKLVARVLEHGYKPINSVVDAYNEAAIFYGLGIGAHCTKSLKPNLPIKLSIADGNERIVPMFQSKSRPVKMNDLIYFQGSELLAWLGRCDVDSDEFKITEITDQVFFLVLGHKDMKESLLFSIAERIKQNLLLANSDVTSSIEIYK